MPPESSSDLNTHPSLSFLSAPILKTYSSSSSLKPVLKKTIQSSNIMLQKDYWLTNDRYWSKCVSESGKQSVRFNPNITQVKYLPETPKQKLTNQQIIKTPNRDLVQFCVSAVSFTAWIMYQTFSTVFNRTLFTATTTQQIKPQSQVKKSASLLERKNTSTAFPYQQAAF
ncbi:hypothetical protein INT48_000413 [Thamnidium elegans]|uniref:Uncharacterized protein n=1 Tax=Thamnidium elegans TaxID=101142 RepID=A0A8H7SI35_9FUNG|nr:hypothetical protein INT48_000413 [Thamnidium elegans]